MEPLRSLLASLPLIRWHHERRDGRGYPDGLSGNAIPLAARLLAVADASITCICWVHERFHAFSDLPQPIVAAVHGYCLGFGFELALMADIRVGSDDAVFALPEATVGVASMPAATCRLAREVGAGWAKLLALTGRRIDAETAERLHIVQAVVPRKLDETAYGIAREIRDNALSPCRASSAPSTRSPTTGSPRRCGSRR